MGIISLVSIINVSIRIASGETTFAKSWSTFVTSGVMIIAMLMWPIITRKYQKKKAERREKKRQKKYREYIERKKKEIKTICDEQSAILRELYITIEECCSVIDNKNIETLGSTKHPKRFYVSPHRSW